MRKYLRFRHEKHYKNSKFHLVADIVFVLCILLLAATLIILRTWEPKEKLVLSIKPLSEKVLSGDLNSFEIEYRAKESLSKNSIAIYWPENFILESVEPADIFNKNTNTFYLDDLEKGSNGKIKVTGLVLAEAGTKEYLVANISCAECQSGISKTLSYQVSGSVLSLEASIPENVYQKVEFPLSLKIKNQGSKDLDNLKLEFASPLSVKEANNNLYSLDDLKAGEEKLLNLNAAFNSEAKEEMLKATIFLELKGQKIRQGELSQIVELKKPSFRAIILGAPEILAYGENVNYEINYENNESLPLDNLKMTFVSGNKNLNFTSVKLLSAPEGAKFSGDSLILPALAPGESGKISLSGSYLKNKAEIKQEAYLDLIVEYDIANEHLRYSVFSSRSKMPSDFKVKSGAYYYSPQGDQLGLGPLPPMVDIATNYWVFWELSNFGSNVTNLVLSAELPENVFWTDHSTVLAGNLRHGEVGGAIIWEVEEINQDGMLDGHPYKVGFELGLIPNQTDLGKALPLLKNINWEAKDVFTGKTLKGSFKDLDTNLEADLLGRGKGVVINADY